MSNNTQQEIASTNECDLLSKTNPNAIFRFTAMLACLIVFVTGLTVYIFSVNKIAAYIMPVILLFCGYPIFKLIKLRAKRSIMALLLGFCYICCLSLMLLLIPADAFGSVSVFVVCFLLLIAATAATLVAVNIKKFHTRELSGTISILCFCALSILLLIYFRNSTSAGFGFQLWRDVAVTFSFESMALTYAGLTFFSIAIIALVAYIFSEKAIELSTKYITYVATFAALSVVFKIMGNAVTNTLAIFGPMFKFTLVYIPWVAAGIVTGPMGALVATGIGDFLGQILLPSGATWFWLTWVSNMLFPIFPALVYKYVRLNKNLDWLKILLGMIASSLVCTLGLGTLALSIIYATDYFALLSTRLLQLVVIGINCALLVSLLPVLRRAKLPSLKLKPIAA